MRPRASRPVHLRLPLRGARQRPPHPSSAPGPPSSRASATTASCSSWAWRPGRCRRAVQAPERRRSAERLAAFQGLPTCNAATKVRPEAAAVPERLQRRP
eukprot:5882037-Alexandrium_andersonii.AAC.1